MVRFYISSQRPRIGLRGNMNYWSLGFQHAMLIYIQFSSTFIRWLRAGFMRLRGHFNIPKQRRCIMRRVARKARAQRDNRHTHPSQKPSMKLCFTRYFLLLAGWWHSLVLKGCTGIHCCLLNCRKLYQVYMAQHIQRRLSYLAKSSLIHHVSPSRYTVSTVIHLQSLHPIAVDNLLSYA